VTLIQNICLLEEVDKNCPVTVCLSSDDEVLPAHVIRVYVERVAQAKKQHHQTGWAEIVWWTGFSHAQCLFSPKALNTVVQTMNDQAHSFSINKRRFSRAVTTTSTISGNGGGCGGRSTTPVPMEDSGQQAAGLSPQ